MSLKSKLQIIIRDKILWVKSLHYRGNLHYCCICNTKSGHFLSGPNMQRKDVRCPRCNSLERHRAQWMYGIGEAIKSFNSKPFSVIHFAPEFCITRFFINQKNCNYKTAEYSKENDADYHIDIQQTGLNSESFDIIICNHILEHVEDDKKAISELFRILKPNGTAFIQAPVDISKNETYEDPSVVSPEDREKHFGQSDHLRLYGVDFQNRLMESGFKVECIEFWKNLDEEQIRYNGITEKEPVYICHKV